MKRFISVILAVLLLVMPLAIGTSADSSKALPLSAGVEALRNQFVSAVAGSEDGVAIDYCYYSPVSESDSTKYPVVIFLHGIGHGSHVNSQCEDSEMAYWASEELQSRWTDTKGAFIVLPRCPEETVQYWNVSFINPLRKMIDDFIAEHRDNVDTTRIFIGGSSAGAEMSWDLITTYPEYFAGAFPLSASGSVNTSQIKAAKGVSIWLFASILDPLVSYPLVVLPIWNSVKKYNDNPENCRLSTYTMVCNPDGSIAWENHRLFQTVSYDFFTIDNQKYPNVTTKDGLGNEINMDYPNGIIAWMSQIHSDYDGTPTDNIKAPNGLDMFFVPMKNIIFKIGNIIQKMLGFV